MKRIALIPLLGIPVVIALALMGGLASGGPSEPTLMEHYSFDVAVNVDFDPSDHADEIDMPDNIKLMATVDFIDPPETLFTIGALDPWVPVEDALDITPNNLLPPFGGFEVEAIGTGTVAGIEDIEVSFTGTFDPEHPSGPRLTGFYTMGTEGGLPGGQAIVYRIKAKPGAPTVPTPTSTPMPTVCPSGAAGCPPTPTNTPTEEEPTAQPATSTPPPVALTEHVDFGCDNEIEVTIRGNGDILGGDDEGIRIDCGLDYAPDGGTGQFDFNESEVVVEPNGIITSSDDDGITIEIFACEESALVLFGRRVIRAVETRCRAIFRVFDSFFGGAGGAPSAVYETDAFTLTGSAAFPPFGATLDSGPIDLPLVQTGGAGADVASLTRVRITFSPFGDVNCDMVANSIDVALILQFIATLLDELNCQDAGDVNWSDAADAIDVALILQFIAGLLPSLPVPAPEQPPPMPATVTPVPSSTPVPPPTAPPATATSPPATSTNTPTVTATATETPETGKISITVEGGPGRPIEVFMSDDCTGSSFASVTISGSISLSFSPGNYSIMAGDVAGWELVKGVDACQEVDLTAGQKVDVTFTYQPVA